MIKQPALFAFSGLLLVVAVGLFAWRGLFYATSVSTTGTVSRIEAHDGQCGSSKHRYSCTEFTAVIDYEAQGRSWSTTTSAGDARGYGQPSTLADHHAGERLPVVYSPNDPGTACHDAIWDVWGVPIFALSAQVITMFGSLFEGKKRRAW